jgi:hypothetical protein
LIKEKEKMSIPEAILNDLQSWVEDHRPTGSFLEAVLDNDLLCAISYADEDCRASLGDLVVLINSISGVPKFVRGAMMEWVNEPATYKVDFYY